MPRSSFNALFAGRWPSCPIHLAMKRFLVFYLVTIMLRNVHIDPRRAGSQVMGKQ